MSAAVGIRCAFGGTNQDWSVLAGMVGTREGTLEVDGMMRHVPHFVRRERGDPLLHGNMQTTQRMLSGNDVTLDRHLVCPTAYALARHSGYDPAAILLLHTVECGVTVEIEGWPDKLDITRGDTRDDICGPVAPGMMWTRDSMTGDPQIRVVVSHTGLPDTVLALLPDRLAGRPLRELVSHPVLDVLDVRIKGVGVAHSGLTWTIDLSGAPRAVTLREAARLYEQA